MKRITSFLFLLGLFLVPNSILAQTADFGTGYLTGVGLGTSDIRLTVVRLIRVALGILGVVFFLIIIYGVVGSGGGREDRGVKARKIIAGGVIGLLIIVIAYAITTWIFNSILVASFAS